MMDMDKWTNVRAVVGALLTEIGPSARFGAAVFPEQGGDSCSSGVEVMPLRLGDRTGSTENAFLQATNFMPKGGTPTAATLDALAPKLASYRGPTFVILATDGGPNCNSKLTCDVTTCTSNIDGAGGCSPDTPSCCDPTRSPGALGCLDGEQTVLAVARLEAMGIHTFVLGIPGSAPYASVLDAAAKAGGTARASEPLYYRADSSGRATLGTQLAQIAARTMASCVFTLSELPADPDQVNVTIGPSMLHQRSPDGWTLQGAQLTLEGASCNAIHQVPPPPISVTQGCPTLR
jgi:hypothetical protein